MKTRSLTSIAVVLVAISLAMTMPLNAFAQIGNQQGMEMVVVAEEGSKVITVTGTIVKTLPTDITFKVTSPNGLNTVAIDQKTPIDGTFETVFTIGENWVEDGSYRITATSGPAQDNSLYTITLPVMVIGGMAQDTMQSDGNLERLIVYKPMTEPNAPTGITIEATGDVGSDIIMVSGDTDKLGEDITLKVIAPNGNIASVEQVSPELDGTYGAIITTGGDFWKEDGMYTVTAQQNDDELYMASAQIEIADGLVVPEFGTIAAMILAVAIISIIVVSARSRLSIVQTATTH